MIAALLAMVVTSEIAFADWLAAQPGTQVSVQVNKNGTIIVRPIGGTWSHPVCPDVSAAVLVQKQFGPFLESAVLDRIYLLLQTAAANGSTVNVFAHPDL
jgi:hypothetical protein